MRLKEKHPSNPLSTPNIFLDLAMRLVALQAALGSLLILETVLISKAEAQSSTVTSCRNIDVRVNTAKNKNLSKGFFATTCGYTLQFQNDGNLVLTNKSGQALWATGSEGKAATLVMQADGNLVIYNDRSLPIWASNTSGNPGAFLSLQNDGNLVIYQKGRAKALWSTNTNGGQARTRSASDEWLEASNPLVPDKSVPPIVPQPVDYMEKYFRDGNLIRISNVSGQVVNLAFQENGKMINSWNLDPNDGDQQFRVTRKPGTNQVKLVRKDSNYLISTKDSYADQSLLESWRDVGGFEPHQTWYIDAVKGTSDKFWIRPIGRSENLMNLPLGANNRKLTLSVFNPSDRDQQFGITVLAKDYPLPPLNTYVLPVPGSTITQLAGDTFSHTNYSGVDFGTGNSNPPVYAVYGGTVMQSAFTNDGGGNTVQIRSDNGEIQFYWHLNTRSVSTGQRITAGQQLGTVGRTGNSTGNHLHIEFRGTNAGTLNWSRARDFEKVLGLYVNKRV